MAVSWTFHKISGENFEPLLFDIINMSEDLCPKYPWGLSDNTVKIYRWQYCQNRDISYFPSHPDIKINSLADVLTIFKPQ